MITIGTSGWQYDSWRGRFYPDDLPKDRWLAYFSRRFPSVEVNNSFYRLPTEEAFARWRTHSTPGFVVTVKASRFITHLKRLKDPGPAIELFWSRARALGEKLGPVLFQLPPRFRCEPGRLRDLLEVLPREIRPALEFRDPSWETDEIRTILDERGAALVLADRPGLDAEPVVTGGWSYVRFHQGQPTSPFYTRERLAWWAERIAALPSRETYVYFNNDPEGAAVHDARVLAQMLEAYPVTVARVGRHGRASA